MASTQSKSVPLHRRAAYRSLVEAWQGRLAVACSGGVDSSALLLLAAEARDRGRIGAFPCFHVNHLTRVESSDEAQTVANTCRALRVPFARLVVESQLRERKRASEDDLRQSRYRALARGIRAMGVDGVVTAHTSDDQTETILMRLLTGAGPLATAGMAADQTLSFGEDVVRIVRPLLSVTRTELQNIVALAGVRTVNDPSNTDVSYRRNRLRSKVIPEISEAFPGFEHAMKRSVGLAQQDATLLDIMAQAATSDVVIDTDSGVGISRAYLRGTHPAIGSRIVRSAILGLMTGDTRELTHERVESVLKAASGRTGATIELPDGITAMVRRDSVDIERRGT